jgi:NitT/TauT family transport system permease protein
MLDIHTAFGNPVAHGWPWPAQTPGGEHTGIIRSALVEANIVSAIRLVIGFILSILLGATLGVLMWRFKMLDEFLGPLFLGLQTLPSVCWVPLAMGARGWRLYRYVLLPASLPALASGLRQGFSFAWRSLMGAEFVFIIDRHGLGYLLQTGRDFNDVAQVMAIMIVMVVLGMIADRLAFAKLEQRVYRRFGLIAAR